jgi:ribonuclease HII
MSVRESREDFALALLPEVTGPDTLVAGVDEVGRGCLFGPVVAAAFLVPCAQIPALVSLGVRDSKLLSPQKRQTIAQQLQGLGGIYRIGYAKAAEIDRLNILQASLLAMRRALVKLPQTPDLCLVDGRETIPNLAFPQYALIKGDRRSPLIAAASILAKVWRDELLGRFAQIYPEYDLGRNKGYGTAKHLCALQEYGISPQHRQSFRPCQVRHNVAAVLGNVLS